MTIMNQHWLNGYKYFDSNEPNENHNTVRNICF